MLYPARRRFHAGLLVWLCLVALAGVAGCDGLFGSDTGAATGTACVKDREALSRLLVQPQACVTSDSCPTGSHCGDTGACDWQCFADSDCGSGMTCTCDGRCTGAGPGGDGGMPPVADPSCPRDRALLTSADTTSRTCTLDQDCPAGSHCDELSQKCTYTCLGTSDA